MKIILSILLILLSFSSCIPEEDPKIPIYRGDLINGKLTESMYDFQSYFSLNTNQFVKSHSIYDWDFAFDCRLDSHFIYLNTGKSIKIAQINKDFDQITENDIPDSLYIDNPNGYGESTIIGKWWESNKKVFIFNAGYDVRRRPQGYYKLEIISFENNTYNIKFQRFGKGLITTTIQKNTDYNFVYLSLAEPNNNLYLEPKKDTWDILFTTKTEFVPFDISKPEENTQYQVRGVYINNNGVRAKLFENKDSLDFNQIEYSNIQGFILNDALNSIGYEWKDFALDSEFYKVYPDKIYIIKSVNGFLYKLRFLKFYNDKGDRGYPEFEYKQL